MIQVYARAESGRIQRPQIQLCAFDRMHIRAGEIQKFETFVPFEEFEIYDVSREKFCLEDGDFTLFVGASCKDIRLSEKIHINGEIIPPRNLEKITRAELYDTESGTEIFTNPLSGMTHIRGMKWHNEIIFQNCDLHNCRSLLIQASAPIDKDEIEIYLDDEKTPSCRISVPVSDGYEDFKDCLTAFPIDGCHNLKLVFHQQICIKAIQVEKA